MTEVWLSQTQTNIQCLAVSFKHGSSFHCCYGWFLIRLYQMIYQIDDDTWCWLFCFGCLDILLFSICTWLFYYFIYLLYRKLYFYPLKHQRNKRNYCFYSSINAEIMQLVLRNALILYWEKELRTKEKYSCNLKKKKLCFRNGNIQNRFRGRPLQIYQ